MRDLLQLDFFLEETGIKVDVVSSGEENEAGQLAVIQLQLRVVDAKKRKPQHKENEAIQFDYNIDKDNPEDVSQEMVRSGYANEEDVKVITRQIRDRVTQYIKDQDRRQQGEASKAAPADSSAPADPNSLTPQKQPLSEASHGHQAAPLAIPGQSFGPPASIPSEVDSGVHSSSLSSFSSIASSATGSVLHAQAADFAAQQQQTQQILQQVLAAQSFQQVSPFFINQIPSLILLQINGNLTFSYCRNSSPFPNIPFWQLQPPRQPPARRQQLLRFPW